MAHNGSIRSLMPTGDRALGPSPAPHAPSAGPLVRLVAGVDPFASSDGAGTSGVS